MANRAWNLRYFSAKLRVGVEEALGSVASTGSSTPVPSAIERGIAAFNKELTTIVYLTGAAMAPTLNAAASSSPGSTSSSASASVEKLLMRWIPRPSAGNLFVGDVVAFSSPLAQAATQSQSVLVRRIAACEGAQLVTDDPEDAALTIPAGHCWVVADNEDLEASHVIDSRSFGPLPIENVMGRIMYYYRSETDCGEVENSEEARSLDEPVLRAELDLEKMGEEQS